MWEGGGNALYKAVLIDDDLLMLEDLEHLVDWESFGFRVVRMFTNGQAALERMEELRPDFIITDIRMPLLDGLSFVSRVREYLPETRILLLTAYSDFDYAKKAIELGVSNYLLKNELNRDTLSEQLKKISADMTRDQNVSAIVMQKDLKRYLYDPEDQQTKERLEHRLKKAYGQAYGMLLVLPRPVLDFPGCPADRAALSRECHEINTALGEPEVGTRLKAEGVRTLCESFMGREVAVLVCAGKMSAGGIDAYAGMHHSASAIADHLKKRLGRACTILYKGELHSTLSGVYRTFLGLKEAAPYTVFQGAGRITEAGLLMDGVREAPYCSDQKIRLKGQIDEGLPGKAGDVLRTIRGEFKQEYSLQRLRTVMEFIRDALDRLRKKDMCLSGPWEDLSNSLEAVNTCDGLLDLLEGFLESVAGFEGGAYSQRIRKSIQFIHEDYNRDISVQDAAKLLGLNGEYLNKMFKKEVGQSFSRYLTRHRMERAKELLEYGNYNVNTAAELVGYKSSQYFSITFRQYMGYPPSEAARHRED